MHMSSLCKSLQSLCVDQVRVHKTPVTTDYTLDYVHVSKAGISTKECVDIMSETVHAFSPPTWPGNGATYMCDIVVGQYVDIQYIVYTCIILICLPNIHIDMSNIIKLGLSNSTVTSNIVT